MQNTNIDVAPVRRANLFQFDMAWQLLAYHLRDLGDEECLWRPYEKGLHMHKQDGSWYADWPEDESYSIGPASIAWTTWHIILWWSMVFDYSFGEGTLRREDVCWPGNMEAVKHKITQLHDEWRTLLETLPDADYLSAERTKWPFTDKPFYELAAWLNLELIKNTSEIGYCRFLYASRG